MRDSRLSTPNRKHTPASRLLVGFRAATRVTDRLYYLLGYMGGLGLLLLGFFITYQVIAQNLDWVHVRGTDSISGYVLALTATWALAYSLRSGSQVRIDVLLPYMRPEVRAVADWLALFAVAFFGGVTGWKMWGNVIADYQRGVVATAYPLVPLYIPKALVAVGFTLLVAVAVQMMLAMLAEKWLPRLHIAMGGVAANCEDSQSMGEAV